MIQNAAQNGVKSTIVKKILDGSLNLPSLFPTCTSLTHFIFYISRYHPNFSLSLSSSSNLKCFQFSLCAYNKFYAQYLCVIGGNLFEILKLLNLLFYAVLCAAECSANFSLQHICLLSYVRS